MLDDPSFDRIGGKVVVSVLAIVVEGLMRLFYWPGWLLLRGLTLGRYPPAKPRTHKWELVGWFGMSVMMALGVVFVWIWVH